MSLNSVRDDVSAEKFLKNTVRDSFSHVGPLEKFASTAPGISRGLLDSVTINPCGLSWDSVYHSTRSSQNKNITSMNSEFCVSVPLGTVGGDIYSGYWGFLWDPQSVYKMREVTHWLVTPVLQPWAAARHLDVLKLKVKREVNLAVKPKDAASSYGSHLPLVLYTNSTIFCIRWDYD